MKQFFIPVLLMVFSISANAQTSRLNVTYKDNLRPGFYLPLEYKTDITEQTILAKLKETGYKPQVKGNIFRKTKKQDGFYVFSGVQLPELNNQMLDLYFKVDQKNDSGYNSAISLLVSKGYDNFVNPDVDSATASAAEKFLNGFVSETASFKLEKEIETQKKMIAESEKKWNQLREKQDDNRKKIAQLEAETQKLHEQETVQQSEVDTLRKSLQDMEGKRQTIQQQ